jgi:ABC-2 type transport system ATP-binding protein
VELRAILMDFITELNREGTTIILTTHYLEEAQRLCKRAGIMNEGKLLALDETGAIISGMSERVLRISLRKGGPPRAAFPQPDKGMLDVSVEENVVKATVAGTMSLKTALHLLDIPLADVKDLKTEEGDLEHAFLRLLKKERPA